MLEKSHIERSLGFRQRGLLLERLQLELRVAAGLLSALHPSVRLPAILRVFPARLLRALLVLESIALSWPEGQRRQRLLIASDRAARRRWWTAVEDGLVYGRLSEDGMT